MGEELSEAIIWIFFLSPYVIFLCVMKKRIFPLFFPWLAYRVIILDRLQSRFLLFILFLLSPSLFSRSLSFPPAVCVAPLFSYMFGCNFHTTNPPPKQTNKKINKKLPKNFLFPPKKKKKKKKK